MLKSFLGVALVALVGCGSSPDTTSDAGPSPAEIIDCEAKAASVCAHCCEVQPYVESTANGGFKKDPIWACSDSPLPDPISSWTVSWCMSDCEAAAVVPCGGTP